MCISADLNLAEFKIIKTNRIKIIKSVTTWAGSESKAYAWYCNEPIPAIGNVTAEFAVKSGNIKAVRDYLRTIAMGGHS